VVGGSVGWKGIAGKVAAVLAGLVWGFFGAVNVVFSDSGSRGEFLQAVALVAGVYFVLGFVAGALGPRTGWAWGLWIGMPGVALLAGYAFVERSALLNILFVGIASVAAVCIGAALGGLTRQTRV
jgi:hypothetical protein